MTNLTSKEAKMGKVMRHTLGASLNIRHNLSSSKGPKPLQLKLLTTYIPKTSAFTLAFSTSQRLRTTRASRSEERRVGKDGRTMRQQKTAYEIGLGIPAEPLFRSSKEAKMGKVMRHTLGASLNIRHNLSSSKGPKPLQLKLLTTYIPKTSAFTLAFSTSQRLRTTRASARTFFTFRHYITPSARNF